MLLRYLQSRPRALFAVIATLLACVSMAGASATLLMEEPYGRLGFFTATGHSAIYLSAVCADSPIVLRPCAPGESGIVLSRYDSLAGYDWLAIPLIPYLYAVDRPEDIPLFADTKMVAFLRDQYRRKHLEDIAPDAAEGASPSGNWPQLVGASYDRTIYGFEFETTPEQDMALIQKYNSSPNRSHFHLASNNCADFAKDVLNVYFPTKFHRSVIADIGITTPKQLAKTLTKIEAQHPELKASRLAISQVPGSMRRSSRSRGVVEAVLKSKHYIIPVAIASPIFAGGVLVAYVGTGGSRVQPDSGALVFNPGADPEQPIAHEDRKAYQRKLKDLLAEINPTASRHGVDKDWEKLQSRAKPGFDDQGSPILEIQLGEHLVRVGASAANVLNSTAPPQFAQQILAARLHSELRHASPHALSNAEIARDWNLLQQTMLLQTRAKDASRITKDDSPLGLSSAPALENFTNHP